MVSKSHLTAVVVGMLLGGALMSMLNSGSNARPSRVVAPVDAPPTTSSGANGTLSVSVITPIPQSVATDAPTATPVPSSAPVSYKITRDDPTTQRCWDGPYGFGRTPKLSLESTTSTATNADVPRADVTTARHIEWMTQPSTFYAAFYSHVKEPSAQQRVFAVPHPKQRLGIVFIEARPHPWIVGSLRNVAHIYGGKDVSLYIFTSMEAMPFMKYHFGDWKNVQYIYAPVTLTWECHGLWLTNHEFYQYFKGGPSHILMTQKDVLMRVEVSDDVFEYPYVGAPWARLPFHQCQPPWVGNGGYSLRHVESMLQLTTNVTRADGLPEDVWFCWAIGAANMKRCPAALASHFGTEQIWNPQSTGAHAIYRDQPLGYVAEYMAQLTSFTTKEFVNGLKSFRNALQNLPKDPPVTRGNVRRSTAQPRAIPRRRPGLNS